MALRRATLGTVLLAACALPAAAPARMSAKRVAKVRADLTREVQRHPGVIAQPWFLRKAGLARYKLPVTLRVRPDPAPTATADLGASLGPRSIALGGSLAADVVFSDSFGGGVMGDVGIEFRQSDTQVLTTSSIPLLWNDDATGCGLKSGAVTGDDDWLGPSQDVDDTVLRTNALRLQVADRATASGGHANLFGNIPGKNVSVDVTLNLKTVINAIVREVDEEDPGTLAECRQLWTGATQNSIPGIHLEGRLTIAPALMPDGRLRIAKVTVSSPPARPARVALSACLLPVSTYGSDPGAPADRPCGGPSDPGLGVVPLAAQDGAQVTVAGDVSVDQVSVDVIVGDA